MKNWRIRLIPVGLLLVVLAFSYSVFEKEQLLKNGEQLFLRFAPVDPRSLMQGDYMILNYAVPTEFVAKMREQIEGELVYIKNAEGVADFNRIYENGQPMDDNERKIYFRTNRWRVAIGANSFFFQEGKAKDFDDAKFAEVRVDESGASILVGLRDKDLKLIGLTSGLSAGME